MVGAGPGDPGLITVKGAECLGKADLILYDHLVNPAVLKHAPPTAEAICSCHREGDPPGAQQSVNEQMIEAAGRGMTVVRLKGGDPDVFSNAAEEIESLAAAGIDFETVSGVTAASRGREALSENLTAAGAHVEQIVVYSSADVQEADPAMKESLEEGTIDWVTVTSSAIARSLVRLFGDDLRQAKLASITR